MKQTKEFQKKRATDLLDQLELLRPQLFDRAVRHGGGLAVQPLPLFHAVRHQRELALQLAVRRVGFRNALRRRCLALQRRVQRLLLRRRRFGERGKLRARVREVELRGLHRLEDAPLGAQREERFALCLDRTEHEEEAHPFVCPIDRFIGQQASTLSLSDKACLSVC